MGEDEKLAAEKEESNSKSAYQTLFQKLTDTITRDKSTVKKKTTTKAPGVTSPPTFHPARARLCEDRPTGRHRPSVRVAACSVQAAERPPSPDIAPTDKSREAERLETAATAKGDLKVRGENKCHSPPWIQ